MINFGQMQKYFTKHFYKDLMSIGRKGSITSDEGWEVPINPTEPIYTDIPCSVSIKTFDTAQEKVEKVNEVLTVYKVFCSPTVDLKSGDYISLTIRDSRGNTLEETKGIAAEPMYYESGIECIVNIVKW